MQKTLLQLKNKGRAEDLLDFSVLQEIVGFQEYYEEEKRYGHDGDHSPESPQ